jgi:transcriptional regulator GlxA family with amidase domain
MDIAILLYDDMTLLDAIGPYEVLRSLPGTRIRFVTVDGAPIRPDTRALTLVPEAGIDAVTTADIVLVPGGPGDALMQADERVCRWLRAIDATTTWTTSVCTGSLILGAAGLLQGRRATSHWMAYDQLASHGALPTAHRFVEDGKYITAAGVSAGIDMALELMRRIAGDEIAQAIQLAIEYDPQPPFDSGSPTKAPATVVELVRAVSADMLAERRNATATCQ